MGFAAVQVIVHEVFTTEEESKNVERVFTTTVPKSWLFQDQNDNTKFYLMFKVEPLTQADLDMILQLARLKGEILDCNTFMLLSEGYDESSNYIKALVDIEKFVEPRLELSNIDSMLSASPQMQCQIAGHSAAPNQDETVASHTGDSYPEILVTTNVQNDNSDTLEDSGLGYFEGNSRNTRIEANSQEILVPLQNDPPVPSIISPDMQVMIQRIEFMINAVNKNLENVEHKLNGKLQITNERLNSIDSKVVVVQNKLHELTILVEKDGRLKKNPDFLGYEEFLSKYKLKTRPFKTMDDFKNFEALFQAAESKKTLYDDLKRHIISTCNNHNAVKKKKCTEILKNFFWRTVLTSYTAQKKPSKTNSTQKNQEYSSPVKEKLTFNTTAFYPCLHDALSNAYYNPIDDEGEKKDPKIPDFSEIILLREIGQVINDARHWDGGRAQRAKRSLENVDEDGSSKLTRRSSSIESMIPGSHVLSNSQSMNIAPIE
ncbi:hypothetical protein QAD02_021411 [Eretmocerus hayati]|uniref:Uncharacterized protein n=1 Tax=Eretmocerus hayati TaxID=131215 RepID=A0ACC2PRJ5_9HYME|nr:hypothetical protein QAD02_021411 [Eretmocerus hayati]